MEHIRKGNDIEIKWAIYVGSGINETPYDLAGKDLSLYLRTSYGRTKVYEFSTDKHVLSFTFWGKDQEKTCVYSLELIENEGREGMHTVDECEAFKIVSHSCEAGGDSEGRVECIHLQFRTNLGISFPTIGLTVDSELSLSSENPVQNKVITLALQEENLRAVEEETKLRNELETQDSRLTLIASSIEVMDDSIQNLVIKIENVDDKLTRIEGAIEGVDFEQVSLVLSKVEELTNDVEQINVTVAENSEAIEILNSDSSVEGSVYNKINKAAEWAAL